MYNMEIHKVLKNGPKNKIYTIIWKRISRRMQVYNQKRVLTFSKYQKKGSRPKIQPKMTLNDL